jgi:hypothetical protein
MCSLKKIGRTILTGYQIFHNYPRSHLPVGERIPRDLARVAVRESLPGDEECECALEKKT